MRKFNNDMGYDFEILKQFDLNKNRPTVIYYEHKHLSTADKNESWKTLQNKGYTIEKSLWNTFAYLD